VSSPESCRDRGAKYRWENLRKPSLVRFRMIFYSHIWDALLKLASIAVLVLAVVSWKIEGWLFWLLVALWMIAYRQFLTIVSSWLYARISLRTNATFAEAKELRRLFQLDLSAKWIPMKEIKKLPSDQRHDALLLALQKAGAGRKAMLF